MTVKLLLRVVSLGKRPPTLPHGMWKYQYCDADVSGFRVGPSFSPGPAMYLAWDWGLSLKFLICKAEKMTTGSTPRGYSEDWLSYLTCQKHGAWHIVRKHSKSFFSSVEVRDHMATQTSHLPRTDLLGATASFPQAIKLTFMALKEWQKHISKKNQWLGSVLLNGGKFSSSLASNFKQTNKKRLILLALSGRQRP